MADARGEVLRGLLFLCVGGAGTWGGGEQGAAREATGAAGGGVRGAAEHGARWLLGGDGVRGPSCAAGLVAQGNRRRARERAENGRREGRGADRGQQRGCGACRLLGGGPPGAGAAPPPRRQEKGNVRGK